MLSGTAPSLIYTPNNNVSGSDSFTFQVNDGVLSSAPATVTITIVPGNKVPTVSAITTNTLEDVAVGIKLKGSDADGDLLSYSIVSIPAKGALSGTPPNLIYQPGKDQNGIDTFSYKANDGQADSTAATVTINITPVNDAPVVGAIPNLSIPKNSTSPPIPFTVSDVDDSVGSLKLTLATSKSSIVANSGIVLGGAGTNRTLTITPVPGATGTVQITVTAGDGKTTGQNGFSLTITNRPPLAVDDSVVTVGGTAQIQTSVLLGNDSDPDGDAITLAGLANMTTAGGRVTLFGGIINYTARDGFTGIDTFTYTIQDSAGATAVGTVSISVSGTARLTAIQPNADRTIVLEFTGPPGKKLPGAGIREYTDLDKDWRFDLRHTGSRPVC